jgi:hypothetical protein
MTDLFEVVPEGTRLTTRILRPRSAKEREILEMLRPMLDGAITEGAAALVPVLKAEVARLAEEAADVEEPALPASERRFEREPVDSAGARSS